MHHLRTEEKAALLIASADDDETSQFSSPIPHDDFPVVSKRPKTYQRRRTSNTHPIFFFVVILSAFIFGCLSGVAIMLYRMSQDVEPSSLINSPKLTNIDLTIKTKLFQSITKTNFLNFNRSIESEINSANKLEEKWKSFSKTFTRVNQLSYDITLSKYSPVKQWTGIQLLDGDTDQELAKFNLLPTNDYLTCSSLIKSGKINANYIYYVNYGRQEDFEYLIKKSQIDLKNNEKTILFMRRKSTIISQTEQIRRAVHYRFAGLVLFDDDDEQQMTGTTNDRQSFSDEWKRLSTGKERQKYLDGISTDDDHQISLLILSYSDVQNIFTSVQSHSNQWLAPPSQWHNKPASLKLGGALQKTKLHSITFMEEIPVHLPIVLAYIRGTIDSEHFIMIGYQLGNIQQEKIIQQIIQAYDSQIQNGWHPRRSIIFCAWSGSSYDRYTIRRWISDNYRLINRNLVAYIDLGNGVIGNSTLNLHGSPLLQQLAQRAADSVVSPLVHDHTCHNRQSKPMPMPHEHSHQRRHADHNMDMDEHEEKVECEQHKLLDEWMRASKNRMGLNKTFSITQMIDIDSSASLFQLQHGIPSLLIEMTDEQAVTNDTFYFKKSPAVVNNDIQPEILVAYTQFVSEIIRQLSDEPLIPFNLTDYANLIDKQTADYLVHYDGAYRSLGSHIGESSEMIKLMSDLTKAIRQIQLQIDGTPKNEYIRLQVLNQKLIEFERLFITDDQLRRMNTADETYKHVLIGPAIGLTNTVVPFPSLSNLLFGMASDPQSELCDAARLYWSRLKEHILLITRTLNGFDGLLSNS